MREQLGYAWILYKFRPQGIDGTVGMIMKEMLLKVHWGRYIVNLLLWNFEAIKVYALKNGF